MNFLPTQKVEQFWYEDRCDAKIESLIQQKKKTKSRTNTDFKGAETMLN